ncbi:CHAT domain-containing protein [Nubsella zeaxanthinifaciens]|jgi:CHAT domain-containing protein|uniref:CHAT domain-containing protein n=1 Tax=Nubsella zeaxanthinifaciens TaxID=392412 RepID=UPI000DE2332D|nr:CHAT domain-containing tetratricopeptide repeat protein [Nubsella zeaxanthinifaciens]
MRRQLFKFVVLILLLHGGIFTFAQSDKRFSILDTLKAHNDLTNWIYEQLDRANSQPKAATQLIIKAQKQAWRTTKNADEHFAWLNLLSTLGYYQLLDGNILGSINSYENALVFFRKNQVLSYNIAEYVLKPLSNNYTRLGDYERALYLQKQGIAFSTDKNEIAAIYANMGISYRSMGRLTDAYSVLNKGLSLKPNPQVTVMLKNILAEVLYDDEKFGEAAAVINDNIKQQKALNAETAYWLMGAYTTSGNIYQKLDQFKLANQQYFKALQLLNHYFLQTRVRERANLYTKIASVYASQLELQKAGIYAKKTLSTLGIVDENGQILKSRIYGDNMLVDVFLMLSKTHLQSNEPNLALNYIDLSLLTADKIRNEFAADKTKERLQGDLKKIVEQGIDICYNLYQKTGDGSYLHHILALAEQSKARTLLDQIQANQRLLSKNLKKDSNFLKKQRLEREISYLEKQLLEKADPTLSKTIDDLKFDLSLVNKTLAKQHQYLPTTDTDIDLKKLPPHRFIEYFIGQHNTYIVNINQNQIVGVIKIANAEKTKLAIGNFVQTYFHQGPAAMMNDPEGFFTASHHIYRLIFAPLKVKNKEQITIIPDGVLGYLSFDGLISKPHFSDHIANWPFLIKSNLVDYAFSIKTLQAQNHTQTGDEFSGLFLTHSKSDKAELKYMEKEANLIREQVAGKFLFDGEVQLKDFNELFAKSKVMHIGTHAYLSGSNNEPTLDFGKEKFYLFELANKTNAPNLIVLSACQTADGVLANGEGIISMARGFNAVGSAATIASLWNVNDEAAATITASFYRYLKKHKNPVVALQQAKLNWMKSEKTSNSLLLPYYWDSLIYIGKNQEINISEPTNWKALLIAIFASAAVGLGAFIYTKRKSMN